jgi:predicted dehydrogenase
MSPILETSPREVVRQAEVGRLRTVIVGANFGAKIARSLARSAPEIAVAGVCDLDNAKAQGLAGELGAPCFPDLEDVLADPEVEAVALFSGPAGRGALVERILRAGKHVMTTKPFELDVGEAARACEAARRTGLALHVNSPAPMAAADMAAIREWTKAGALGRPITLQATTWADYREVADGSWLDDPMRCPAAPLFRLGVYFLGEFAGLLGRPVRLSVQQSRIRTGRPTADTAQLQIEYESGAMANVFASFCVGDGRPWADEVMIAYEGGRIRRWMERTGDSDMSQDRAVVELHRPGEPVVRVKTAPGDFTGWYNWRAFHEAARGRPGSVKLDAEGLLTSVRLLSALTRAARSGAVETV